MLDLHPPTDDLTNEAIKLGAVHIELDQFR
jgi:hypothetical protein